MREPLTFIIPTYNNIDQLTQCVQSLLYSGVWYPVKIIVVNNGSAPFSFPADQPIEVIQTSKNLGWEGGLKAGLAHTDSKYVVFCNDDVFLPKSSARHFKDMVRAMEVYPKIGAMGPSTNVAMGWQNIWASPYNGAFPVPFLIGFCLLVRQSALAEAGGIDESAPGGDDIDLSIRLRAKGYDLVCYKDAFIYHHGFQTGTRVHGDPTQPMGWNSKAMTERTNDWLIRKHGFLAWWFTMMQARPIEHPQSDEDSDIEGAMIIPFIKKGKVVELGVGAKKTVPEAIGVDEVPKGQPIHLLGDHLSVANVVADVTEDLPFTENSVDTIIARHIIEHVVDVLDVLAKWSAPLKKGGRLIIATPNEELSETIPLNPEHVHAFTPKSLRKLGEAVGLTYVTSLRHVNGISFIEVFTK